MLHREMMLAARSISPATTDRQLDEQVERIESLLRRSGVARTAWLRELLVQLRGLRA